MRITLDYPPSANRYWRYNRGHVHRSNEANAYIAYVGLLCSAEGVEPFDGDVRVTLHFFRPAKRGDIDNFSKLTLDSLRGLAYHDDSQIVELHAYRYDDKHAPRVEVTVEELSNG